MSTFLHEFHFEKLFSLRENLENAFNTISISTKSQNLFNILESTLA